MGGRVISCLLANSLNERLLEAAGMEETVPQAAKRKMNNAEWHQVQYAEISTGPPPHSVKKP